MTMILIADAPVDIDGEGFLTNPEQWNERIAAAIAAENGVPVKELYQLFPKGPAKLAAKIGGIPKPKGCI